MASAISCREQERAINRIIVVEVVTLLNSDRLIDEYFGEMTASLLTYLPR